MLDKMHSPVKWFETSLLAISAFNIIVVFFTLVWNIRRIQPAGIFLLIWLFIAGVAMAMMFIIDTGLIIYVPWLFLVPSPLYYLLFPAGYLYIRMLVRDEVRLNKWDVLHAFPALVHLIELWPFFTQTYTYKLEVVQEVISRPLGTFAHAEGLLSDYQHNILRGVMGFCYLLAIFQLLRRDRNDQNRDLTAFPAMVRWLKTFGGMQFIIALALVSFLGFPSLAPPEVRATLLYLLIACSVIGTAMVLIFNQGLMYGMPSFATKQVLPSSTPLPTFRETFDQPSIELPGAENATREQALLKRLEAFMDLKKPYLNHRYHISDLAADLGVPAHHISYALNNVLKIKYADYMNQNRLEHMKHLVDAGELSNYTLEALALKSGFNSRITFIRAVQKLKGMNPSAYFKKGNEPGNTISR
jgi:AraC-like DNA-binding protein